MTHADPEGVRGTAPAPEAGSGPGPGAAPSVDPSAAAPDAVTSPGAAPLSSLSALLGSGFEAGSACAADGTCD